uniref:Uncharacterized protein n=1 Tax=Plectus sambesii TaxID=2011161 RepID=A0A914W715_9BILA
MQLILLVCLVAASITVGLSQPNPWMMNRSPWGNSGRNNMQFDNRWNNNRFNDRHHHDSHGRGGTTCTGTWPLLGTRCVSTDPRCRCIDVGTIFQHICQCMRF